MKKLMYKLIWLLACMDIGLYLNGVSGMFIGFLTAWTAPFILGALLVHIASLVHE